MLKLADFGLAQFLAFDQKLDQPCGSPIYIAPEVKGENDNKLA